MKKIIIGVFLLTSVIVYQYFNTPLARSANEFIVGMTGGYAPWVSINEQGEYEGFDIDVAESLAKQMGKKLVLKDLGCMTSLFAALESETIDAIVWGMSMTQDRLKKVAMINYQGERVRSYPLLFWCKIPAEIESIHDMKDRLVCVEPASSQENVLLKYDFIKPLTVDKVDDALLNLQYGKADAALVEPAIAKKFKHKYPQIQILDVPLDAHDAVDGVGIVIKKNKQELFDEVSKVVATLKSSGIIAQLEQKWEIGS